MTFPANSYVVLDIPPPFAERVLALRRRHGDAFRWSLPAETTVSGSSGTGPISTDEEPERVYATLDRIAAATAPIRASFGPVRRFPNSDVFYLSFLDEAPLRALHERLGSSGLRFQPTPFPFGPHCTLRTHGPVTGADAQSIGAERIEGEFLLDTMTLYDLPARTASPIGFTTLLCLLQQVSLTGTT